MHRHRSPVDCRRCRSGYRFRRNVPCSCVSRKRRVVETARLERQHNRPPAPHQRSDLASVSDSPHGARRDDRIGRREALSAHRRFVAEQETSDLAPALSRLSNRSTLVAGDAKSAARAVDPEATVGPDQTAATDDLRESANAGGGAPPRVLEIVHRDTLAEHGRGACNASNATVMAGPQAAPSSKGAGVSLDRLCSVLTFVLCAILDAALWRARSHRASVAPSLCVIADRANDDVAVCARVPDDHAHGRDISTVAASGRRELGAPVLRGRSRFGSTDQAGSIPASTG
jgi:hypothetical protein